MRVLVTGGTGFVGANLVQRLLRDGHELHLLARESSDFWRLAEVKSHLQIHCVDLQDAESVNQAVGQIRPEWVLHLAVYGAYSFQNDLNQMLHSNILGTANLLQACERTGFAAFINTGSSSEYGYKPYAPAETEVLEPNSYYAVTKAAATNLCSYTSRRIRLPITTLRLYSVYGPYEEPRRFIPRLIMHGLRGEFPPLVSPDTARDFIYVDDVVNAYLKVLTNPGISLGAVYNIGSGTQTRIRDVVDTARRLMAISAEPQWGSMERRSWDTETWVADRTKAERELNWSPQHTMEAGLQKTIPWLRDHIDLYPLDDA